MSNPELSPSRAFLEAAKSASEAFYAGFQEGLKSDKSLTAEEWKHLSECSYRLSEAAFPGIHALMDGDEKEFDRIFDNLLSE